MTLAPASPFAALFGLLLALPQGAPETPEAAPASEASGTAPAPQDANLRAIEEMSLEDMLELDVAVASQKGTRVREAPGIVTVVSREEIVTLGARDLIDVLHWVGGFTLALDVENVTDAGFRGMWAHEGKILLMVDGQEFDDPLFSNLAMGYHYPLHNVQRIEIIRGPGSVIYGGNAELAVINIITRNAEEIGMVGAQVEYGQLQRDYARRGLQLELAHRFTEANVALTGSLAVGQGRRSDGLFMDFDGGTPYRGTGDNARLDPLFVNLGATWNDLKLRFILDDYRTTDRYANYIADKPQTVSFFSILADARYDWHLSDTVTLTPRVAYRHQLPWNSTSRASDNQDFYDKVADRTQASVTANWEILESLSFMGGFQFTFDHAYARLPGASADPTGTQSSFDAAKHSFVSYENYALYAQLIWTSPWVNITAGARFEVHSEYGPSFVPRLALTKAFDKWHFKALATEAFRAPAIENIHFNPAILPERTWVFELEAGYEINESMYVALNGYDMTIRRPIIYDVNDDDTESYHNYPRTGTTGLEVEYRYHGAHGFATANYSLALAAGKNQVPQYAVPGDRNAMLAFPNHKASLTAGAKFGDHFTVAPSLIFLGPRYGYISEETTVSRAGATWLLNVFLSYRDLGLDGLDLGLGGYNLLGENFLYIQPYSGGHRPIPGLPREVMLRLSYALR